MNISSHRIRRSHVPSFFSAVILTLTLSLGGACARNSVARRTADIKPATSPEKPTAKAPEKPVGPSAEKPVGPSTEREAGKSLDDEPPITAAGLVTTLALHSGSGPLELSDEYLGVVRVPWGSRFSPAPACRRWSSPGKKNWSARSWASCRRTTCIVRRKRPSGPAPSG